MCVNVSEPILHNSLGIHKYSPSIDIINDHLNSIILNCPIIYVWFGFAYYHLPGCPVVFSQNQRLTAGPFTLSLSALPLLQP